MEEKPRRPKRKMVTLQCATCQAIETVGMRGGIIDVHWKWVQFGDEIFHLSKCGKAKAVMIDDDD